MMKIEICGEEVLPYCYNCGEDIQFPFEPFLVCFEPPVINYPREPDIPGELYLICNECVSAEIWERDNE